MECASFLRQAQHDPTRQSLHGLDVQVLATRLGVRHTGTSDASAEMYLDELTGRELAAARWYLNRTTAPDAYSDLDWPPDAVLAFGTVSELDLHLRFEIWWRPGEALLVGILGTEAQERRGTARVFCVAQWREHQAPRSFADMVRRYRRRILHRAGAYLWALLKAVLVVVKPFKLLHLQWCLRREREQAKAAVEAGPTVLLVKTSVEKPAKKAADVVKIVVTLGGILVILLIGGRACSAVGVNSPDGPLPSKSSQQQVDSGTGKTKKGDQKDQKGKKPPGQHKGPSGGKGGGRR